jgi:hypothetical protein
VREGGSGGVGEGKECVCEGVRESVSVLVCVCVCVGVCVGGWVSE